ncbi:hypothetical protein ABZ904_13805 [Streptomyces sp. NPDC046900]|uniref:hypothetical protein n=1 Tax=Streptomyces sp. NPDC046900 TaxID=3155473 RepID=UPI0033EBB98F
MRTLLEWLLSLLLPAQGKRRAESEPAAPILRAPAQRPAGDAIDADTLPLVRPYLVAWERRQEREAQRERRTAAALASFGVDYPYGPQAGVA